MKKTNKVNPLTHFNNTKTAGYKKASKEMANYKKSLPKAQPGIFVGPQTEMQSILSNQPPIPRPNRPSNVDIANAAGQSAVAKIAAAQKAATQRAIRGAAIFDNYNTRRNSGPIKRKKK